MLLSMSRRSPGDFSETWDRNGISISLDPRTTRAWCSPGAVSFEIDQGRRLCRLAACGSVSSVANAGLAIQNSPNAAMRKPHRASIAPVPPDRTLLLNPIDFRVPPGIARKLTQRRGNAKSGSRVGQAWVKSCKAEEKIDLDQAVSHYGGTQCTRCGARGAYHA